MLGITMLIMIIRIHFIETSYFMRKREKMIEIFDFESLQDELIISPEKGDLIAGTGGCRKIRCRKREQKKGKSGGVRIIYYYLTVDSEIYFLDVYEKSSQESLKADQKKTLKKIIAEIDNER